MITEKDLSPQQCIEYRIWKEIDKRLAEFGYKTSRDEYDYNYIHLCKKTGLFGLVCNKYICSFDYDKSKHELVSTMIKQDKYVEVLYTCNILFGNIEHLSVVVRKDYCLVNK